MRVNKRLSLGASTSGVINPNLPATAVSKWTATALGAGIVTVTPIIQGVTTHEGWTISDSSIEINLPIADAWNFEVDGSGGAEIFLTGE